MRSAGGADEPSIRASSCETLARVMASMSNAYVVSAGVIG